MEFKIYSTKEEFIKDNLDINKLDFYNQIEMSFFSKNIYDYQQFNNNSYAIKFWNDEDILLILKVPNRNMLIYGSDKLINFAVNVIADYHLNVSSILGKTELISSFIKTYQKRLGGKVSYQRDMYVFTNKNSVINNEISNNVVKLSSADKKQLVELLGAFYKEEIKKEYTYSELLDILNKSDDEFYAYKENNKFVSLARKRKSYGMSSCISGVFTLPEYRCKGYASKVINSLLIDSVNNGFGSYLFVDADNHYAQELYKKLGFKYYLNYTQINYAQTNIKQVLFAGGCFWCMAKPYYEYDGILKVFSGYAGGTEINPTYEMVKKGLTHHRETVMLEYDENIISYQELLNIYFETIDPFDEGGQFIDRGDNYTCAVYTSNLFHLDIILNFIDKIEKDFKRKVAVKVLEDVVFYKAEEYHQDYALKNPEAMEEELKSSGRLK